MCHNFFPELFVFILMQQKSRNIHCTDRGKFHHKRKKIVISFELFAQRIKSLLP